ncbi:hypothetical protein FKP32DRAFT_1599861 [Trametes sanguinea]|nr:hypothetical protein FKP32DRAFT_1599861 [Trametes sanguinea]
MKPEWRPTSIGSRVSATPGIRGGDPSTDHAPALGAGGDVIAEVAAGSTRYHESLLDQIRKNIEYKVGRRQPPLPEGVKQPKVENPGKYSGERDHDSFYRWLDGYLSWLRAYNLCGPETDDTRVQLLRTYVTGTAEEWFIQEVDHPDSSRRKSFTEVICDMHRRFVHASSAGKATLDYERCHYRPQDGVDAFLAELRKHAQRMIQRPSEYDMKRKFVNSLPNDMYDILVVHRGLRPEFSTLEELATHARQIEEARRMQRDRDRERGTAIPVRVSAPRVPARRAPTADPAAPRDTRASNSPGVAPTRPGIVQRRDDTRTTAPGKAPVGACFACGKTGHYANDPVCAEFGKPHSRPPRPRARLHAQRTVGDEEDEADSGERAASDAEDGHDEDTDAAYDWGGDQYDSGDDGSEVERAHAMRAE